MFGSMMDRPLLISSLLEHAGRSSAKPKSFRARRTARIFRYTYAECAARAADWPTRSPPRACAGSRVGTLAWNNHRHLESYFAVSGSGAVLHTCNPRLHPEQLVYIINHAEDGCCSSTAAFLPLVEAIAPRCPRFDALGLPERRGGHAAKRALPNCSATRSCSTAQDDDFEWPEFDERTAASLCYTSGTTGNPKGVLYSHRSTVLHTFALMHARTRCRSPRATACCRSCRCSTSTRGAFPTRRRWAAQAGAARSAARRREPVRTDRGRSA